MPAKMRQKALKMALSLKAENGDLAVVSSLSSIKKTGEAKALLNNLNVAGNAAFTVVLGSQNKGITNALRNVKKARVESYSNLNAYKVFNGGIILMDKNIFTTSKKIPDRVKRSKKGGEKQKS